MKWTPCNEETAGAKLATVRRHVCGWKNDTAHPRRTPVTAKKTDDDDEPPLRATADRVAVPNILGQLGRWIGVCVCVCLFICC